MKRDRIAVVHSMHLWLSQTMTWLHTQVRSLPQRIESHVVCDKVAHLDQFSTPNLVSADNDGMLWRLAARHAWPIARRRNLYLLERQMRRSGAMILHSHFGDRGWCNIDLVRKLGARHVVTYYGYDVGRLPRVEPVWRTRYAELFGSAHLFLCEGPFMARSLVELGCPREKIKVHHLGVNIGSIGVAPRLWQPGTPLRVLLAGSFVEKKGLPYAVAALGRIACRVELEISIVGDADSKPEHQLEKSRILAAVEAAGLGPRAKFFGYCTYEKLLATAQRCHVLVAPSVTASDGDSEGGAPVTIIEMAASGMPVVSTRHCDIPEVLEDGVSGLLAEERDVDGLTEKLNWLIDHPDAWQPLIRAARRRIEAEFDATIQGRRLASCYDQVVDGS